MIAGSEGSQRSQRSERRLLTGNQAAAWGARLGGVDYVPAFPITPQTEIIEALAAWFDDGSLMGRLTMFESEHSMMTAAGTAAAAGARTFTATSSQGLLYSLEMMYAVAGWRVPFVMVNVSRGLASPITLESDHNDVLAARDTGFLQIHCATAQEVLDAVLIAFRWSEDRRVRLPVIVNQDGFSLSFTREPVDIPNEDAVRAFLPTRGDLDETLSGPSPQSLGVAVLDGSTYSYFRYQMERAAQGALPVLLDIEKEFESMTGRRFLPIDEYRMHDAEMAIVVVGSLGTQAMVAVDEMRAEGVRVGLVRPRVLRPFPRNALALTLGRMRGVAVVDQDLSPGFGGILHGEIAAALYARPEPRPSLTSYIGGLGGRFVSVTEFKRIVDETVVASITGHVPPPRLLFTDEEARSIRMLQQIADDAPQYELGAPFASGLEGDRA
ncbi:MAG: pyruvate synthase [Deltaproteobacteria bacterium]|nr:pyruvate synthase [Deltaproteobacteria bacterium]